MDLIYSDPGIGHPRISQYVTSAMSDRVLLRHPLLHAEVLRFRLDSSFADGSPLYSKESYIADWERATARLPGEDVVTLATQVTEAYLKKVSDRKIDVITVWASSPNAREIATRFTLCLLADPINRERGSSTNYEFETAWTRTMTASNVEPLSLPNLPSSLSPNASYGRMSRLPLVNGTTLLTSMTATALRRSPLSPRHTTRPLIAATAQRGVGLEAVVPSVVPSSGRLPSKHGATRYTAYVFDRNVDATDCKVVPAVKADPGAQPTCSADRQKCCSTAMSMLPPYLRQQCRSAAMPMRLTSDRNVVRQKCRCSSPQNLPLH